MKVKELIEHLSKFDPEMLVCTYLEGDEHTPIESPKVIEAVYNSFDGSYTQFQPNINKFQTEYWRERKIDPRFQSKSDQQICNDMIAKCEQVEDKDLEMSVLTTKLVIIE